MLEQRILTTIKNILNILFSRSEVWIHRRIQKVNKRIQALAGFKATQRKCQNNILFHRIFFIFNTCSNLFYLRANSVLTTSCISTSKWLRNNLKVFTSYRGFSFCFGMSNIHNILWVYSPTYFYMQHDLHIIYSNLRHKSPPYRDIQQWCKIQLKIQNIYIILFSSSVFYMFNVDHSCHSCSKS